MTKRSLGRVAVKQNCVTVKKLAALAEPALFVGPRAGFLLAHSALLGDVLLEQWHERAAVGIRDQLGHSYTHPPPAS